MMSLLIPENLNDIAAFLNTDPYMHLYAIGDLDERFGPFIDWYGAEGPDGISSVICVYKGGESPTVMAFSAEPEGSMSGLLKMIIPRLPDHFQAHLSPGLEKLFVPEYMVESAKAYYKMALHDTELPAKHDFNGVEKLCGNDIPALLELYAASYPGNWFEPDMFDLNCYFGMRKEGRLIAAAGTHVYSPAYKAAALGNITTRPEYRGGGYGMRVTAGICRFLLAQNIRIGLNVKQDNPAAIACYRKTGFEINAEYGEYIFRKNR